MLKRAWLLVSRALIASLTLLPIWLAYVVPFVRMRRIIPLLAPDDVAGARERRTPAAVGGLRHSADVIEMQVRRDDYVDGIRCHTN